MATDWEDLTDEFLDGLNEEEVAAALGIGVAMDVPEAQVAQPLPSSIQLPTGVLQQLEGSPSPAMPSRHLIPLVCRVGRLEPEEPTTTTAANIATLGQYFGEERPAQHLTKAAIAEKLGLNRHSLESSLSTFANSLLHIDRGQVTDLETMLLHSPLQPVAYIELVRYDETPLRVTHKDLLDLLLPASTPSRFEDNELVEQDPAPAAASGALATKATTESKLFYTEQRYAMLLRHPVSEEAEGINYVAFHGSSLTWYQRLEAGTGPCECKRLDAVRPFHRGHLQVSLCWPDMHNGPSPCQLCSGAVSISKSQQRWGTLAQTTPALQCPCGGTDYGIHLCPLQQHHHRSHQRLACLEHSRCPLPVQESFGQDHSREVDHKKRTCVWCCGCLRPVGSGHMLQDRDQAVSETPAPRAVCQWRLAPPPPGRALCACGC